MKRILMAILAVSALQADVFAMKRTRLGGAPVEYTGYEAAVQGTRQNKRGPKRQQVVVGDVVAAVAAPEVRLEEARLAAVLPVVQADRVYTAEEMEAWLTDVLAEEAGDVDGAVTPVIFAGEHTTFEDVAPEVPGLGVMGEEYAAFAAEQARIQAKHDAAATIIQKAFRAKRRAFVMHPLQVLANEGMTSGVAAVKATKATAVVDEDTVEMEKAAEAVRKAQEIFLAKEAKLAEAKALKAAADKQARKEAKKIARIHAIAAENDAATKAAIKQRADEERAAREAVIRVELLAQEAARVQAEQEAEAAALAARLEKAPWIKFQFEKNARELMDINTDIAALDAKAAVAASYNPMSFIASFIPGTATYNAATRRAELEQRRTALDAAQADLLASLPA
jgi:hypothetical protein